VDQAPTARPIIIWFGLSCSRPPGCVSRSPRLYAGTTRGFGLHWPPSSSTLALPGRPVRGVSCFTTHTLAHTHRPVGGLWVRCLWVQCRRRPARVSGGAVCASADGGLPCTGRGCPICTASTRRTPGAPRVSACVFLCTRAYIYTQALVDSPVIQCRRSRRTDRSSWRTSPS
jgi:hypothetical protein